MASVIQNFKMGILNRMDITQLSLSNQYQVTISGFTGALKGYLGSKYNLPSRYSSGSSIGIMCSDARLPSSSFATLEITDNYQGIKQHVPHFRNYIETDFSFYVDVKHHSLKFFEGWMDYIAGDSDPQGRAKTEGYYRRFNYPMDSQGKVGYKCNTLSIVKFDKNGQNLLGYEFINAFPKRLDTSPITYGQAEVMKVQIQIAYDRYVAISATGAKNTPRSSIKGSGTKEDPWIRPAIRMNDGN